MHILLKSSFLRLPQLSLFLRLAMAVIGAGLAGVLSFSATATAQDNQGYAVALTANERDSGWGTYSTGGVMILTDSNGNNSRRQFDARVLEAPADIDGAGERSVFRFTGPSNIRGVTLLSHAYGNKSDEQWLYLSSDDRTTQIASGDQTSAFVGSEFSYEDMTSVEVEKFSYEYDVQEACPGGDGVLQCHKIKRMPLDEISGYSLEVFWTDVEEYRTFRVDFYDRKGEPFKVLQAAEFKMYEDYYWRPGAMRMSNLQSGRATTILFLGFEFDVEQDRDLFTVEAIENGR